MRQCYQRHAGEIGAERRAYKRFLFFVLLEQTPKEGRANRYKEKLVVYEG